MHKDTNMRTFLFTNYFISRRFGVLEGLPPRSLGVSAGQGSTIHPTSQPGIHQCHAAGLNHTQRGGHRSRPIRSPHFGEADDRPQLN